MISSKNSMYDELPKNLKKSKQKPQPPWKSFPEFILKWRLLQCQTMFCDLLDAQVFRISGHLSGCLTITPKPFFSPLNFIRKTWNFSARQSRVRQLKAAQISRGAEHSLLNPPRNFLLSSTTTILYRRLKEGSRLCFNSLADTGKLPREYDRVSSSQAGSCHLQAECKPWNSVHHLSIAWLMQQNSPGSPFKGGALLVWREGQSLLYSLCSLQCLKSFRTCSRKSPHKL